MAWSIAPTIGKQYTYSMSVRKRKADQFRNLWDGEGPSSGMQALAGGHVRGCRSQNMGIEIGRICAGIRFGFHGRPFPCRGGMRAPRPAAACGAVALIMPQALCVCALDSIGACLPATGDAHHLGV